MIRIGVRSAALAATLALIPASALSDSRAQKYYYEDITEPFFVLDPARPGWYRADRPGAAVSSFPAVKSPDAFRVFVIGGSIARLLSGSGDESVDFGKFLQAVLPSRKVEVLNCGMAGYESYREALIEQEILEYAPDLIVFLTGHNEGIASAPIPIWIMRAQERLSRIGAYRALVGTFQPDGARKEAYNDAWSDSRDAAFARNLADNLRHARERGAETAIVVPPRNYREPVEAERSPYDADFISGWLRFLRRDYAGARRLWKESLAQRSGAGAAESADKSFDWGFIARSEEQMGLEDDARASFEQAALFDRKICSTTCADILRRVTAQEGGVLVEADRMFRALAHPRMPGMETFNDRMHWKPRFNCLMASEIVASARLNPRLEALPWDDARFRAMKDSCEKPGGPGGEKDDLRILSYVLMGLSGTNLDRLSTVSVFYLRAIREHRPEWFQNVPALMKKTVNPQTQVYGLTMAPDAVVLPRLYWHIAEARMLEKDYAGAAADFSTALELDPSLAWARIGRAIAETLGGDKDRGLALLKDAMARSAGYAGRDQYLASAVAAAKALELGSEEEVSAPDPDHWIRKAAAAIAAEDKSAGLAALARARALSPRPDQLRLVGQYYRMLREPGKFLELSGALTAAFPKDVNVWLMTAEASLQEGRREDGFAALSRAEALGPDARQARVIESLRRPAGAGQTE